MSNANTLDLDATSEDTLDIHPLVLTGALITGLTIAIIVGVTAFGGALNTFFSGLATTVGSF